MKKILPILFIFLFAWQGVSAEQIYYSSLGASSSFVNVSPEVKLIVAENDWVELACFEAKYQGGQTISSLTFLSDSLKKTIDESMSVIGGLTMPDTEKTIFDMEQKLENVCNSITLEQAQNQLNDFITMAEMAKNELQADIKQELENNFNAKVLELRKKIEEGVQAEIESLKAEIMTKLESEAKAEADAKKKKLEASLKTEIKRRASSLELGTSAEEIEENVKMLVEAQVDIAKKELEQKYIDLAKAEEDQLRLSVETKANKLGGDEKRKFENLKQKLIVFGNINLKAVPNKYENFKFKALNKRLDILKLISAFQMNRVKEAIKKNEASINKAIVAGKNIETADIMVAKLESDFAILINDTKSADDIKKNSEQLKAKWSNIQSQLERVSLSQTKEIISLIQKNIKDKNLEGGLLKFDERYNNYLKKYNEVQAKCVEKDEAEFYCQKGVGLKTNMDKFNDGKKGVENIRAKLDELNNFDENNTLDEILKFKDDLVELVNENLAVINALRNVN